jgi:hypothetical protein
MGAAKTMPTSERPHWFPFLPCPLDTGETVPQPDLSTLLHSIRGAVTDFSEHDFAWPVLFPNTLRRDVMALSKTGLERRLPRRFPVGAKYVVEGYGGAEGQLRVIARYVVLPGGQRINVLGARVPSFSRSRSQASRAPRKIRAGTVVKNLTVRRGTTARASR